MKQYHHGDLKESALIIAHEILDAEGVDEIKIREIARRLEVSPTALYHHFENRDALLTLLVQRLFKGFIETWSRLSLMDLGIFYIEYYIKHPAYFDLMFDNKLAKSPIIQEIRKECYDLLRNKIDGQGEQKEVKALFLWTMVQGLATLYKIKALGNEEASEVLGNSLYSQAPAELWKTFGRFLDT